MKRGQSKDPTFLDACRAATPHFTRILVGASWWPSPTSNVSTWVCASAPAQPPTSADRQGAFSRLSKALKQSSVFVVAQQRNGRGSSRLSKPTGGTLSS